MKGLLTTHTFRIYNSSLPGFVLLSQLRYFLADFASQIFHLSDGSGFVLLSPNLSSNKLLYLQGIITL